MCTTCTTRHNVLACSSRLRIFLVWSIKDITFLLGQHAWRICRKHIGPVIPAFYQNENDDYGIFNREL